MKNGQKEILAVEKGFSRYIQTCLFHTSRDFFRKIDREYHRTEPLNEDFDTDALNVTINFFSSTLYVEAHEYLRSAIQTLNPMEKKLLFLKFYDEKTDAEIANSFGLTQQAISKSKKLLLDKLKNQLEV
ncbi:sigma-70 family RNA polymerase sigma factor [Paenibacillus taichungensis]